MIQKILAVLVFCAGAAMLVYDRVIRAGAVREAYEACIANPTIGQDYARMCEAYQPIVPWFLYAVVVFAAIWLWSLGD